MRWSSEKSASGIQAETATISLFKGCCIATIILGLFISVLLHGGRRGLNSVDYVHKRHALDLESGKWKPRLLPQDAYQRPLSGMIAANLAAAIPEAETPVRLVWAFIHLTNAALLGLLVYRLVLSRTIAVCSILLFLVPVPATESILWHTGAAGSSLALTPFLLCLHFLLTACLRDARWLVTATIGIAAFVLVLLTYEQYAPGVFLLPFFVLYLSWTDERLRRRKRLGRALFLTFVALVVGILYWFLILSHAWSIGDRGGLDLDSPGRLTIRGIEVYKRVIFLTVGQWGLGGMWTQALRLGIDQISHNPVTVISLGLLTLTVVGMAASSKWIIEEDRASISANPPLGGLYWIGILWSALAFVTAVVLRNQGVWPKTLYFPWAGFTLSLAACLESLRRHLTRQRAWPGQLMILLVGVVYIMGVIVLAGFTHVYRFRAAHDKQQIAALVKAAPNLPRDIKVPPGHTHPHYRDAIVLLPIDPDERAVSDVTGKHTQLDLYLGGVFEFPWSTETAMQMAYRYEDIRALPSDRLARLRFTEVHLSPYGNVEWIAVNGRRVATSQLLAFTYADGTVALVTALDLVYPNGTEVKVSLPLARRVSAPDSTMTEMRFELEQAGRHASQ